ncbi:MAG: response regulator transcription factor [Actinomycetota bacterium]|nr:response regulator transcription factor [Actinomycetota bacterium]
MADVWVYAPDEASASEMGRALARLGFTPHRAPEGRGTDPPGQRPGLAVLVGGPGEPAPLEAWERVRDQHDLGDVPVIFTVDSGGLEASDPLLEAHEVIVRPFSPVELEVRVARARGRANGVEAGDIVRAGSLELNLATYQAAIEGEPIDFTYMEYELLKFLMTNPDRVFPRESLLNAVWGYDYYGGARTVDVHVRRVRAKLGEKYASRLVTIRSVGYRFER